MHWHPTPEIGGGEKRAVLMRGGAVRIKVLIGGAFRHFSVRLCLFDGLATSYRMKNIEQSRITSDNEVTND
jgi:hypothetical protein